MDLAHIRRRLGATAGAFGHQGRGQVVGGGFIGRPRSHHVEDPGSRDYRWLLVLDGAGWASDEHGRRQRILPGDGFVRAPLTPHVIERDRDPPFLEFFISLPLGLHRALVDAGAIDPAQRHFSVALETELLRGLVAFVDRLGGGGAGHAASVVAAVGELLALVQRSAAGDDHLEQARRELERDLDHPLDLGALAAETGLSSDGFRLAFRRRYGRNPKAWRIRARITAAQGLLLGGASVREAAEALGYPDPFAFSKQFKREVGVPPSTYSRR